MVVCPSVEGVTPQLYNGGSVLRLARLLHDQGEGVCKDTLLFMTDRSSIEYDEEHHLRWCVLVICLYMHDHMIMIITFSVDVLAQEIKSRTTIAYSHGSGARLRV